MFSGKGRRLKQAKEEAQSEIESYRNQREGQYKKYEQSVSTIQFLKIWTPKTFAVITLHFEQGGFTIE